MEVEPEGKRLHDRIAAWAKGAIPKLREIEPEIPEELSDRQGDGAEPLLGIAEFVGHGWPQKARDALLDLCKSADAEDSSHGVRLLKDIATIFVEAETDKLFSSTLVDKLKEIEGSPWPEYGHGNPISKTALAKLLGRFKDHGGEIPITPRMVDIGGEKKRGYFRKFFLDAWRRYVPDVQKSLLTDADQDPEPDADQKERASHAEAQADFFHSPNDTASCGCTSENQSATKVQPVSTNKDADSITVALQKGGMEEGRQKSRKVDL